MGSTTPGTPQHKEEKNAVFPKSHFLHLKPILELEHLMVILKYERLEQVTAKTQALFFCASYIFRHKSQRAFQKTP